MDQKRLLEKAALYCSRAEKAPNEVIEKLKTWSNGVISKREITEIIYELTEQRYLDEERYVRAFVSDKRRFNGYGPHKIRYALLTKGLPERLVNQALDEVDSEEWRAPLEEYLRRKLPTELDDPKLLGEKLFRSAYSRGYDSEMISRVLRQIFTEKSYEAE